MKRQLTFGFEQTSDKKWIKRLSEGQQEAIRMALKEIMVAYFKISRRCSLVDTEAEKKSAKQLSRY